MDPNSRPALTPTQRVQRAFTLVELMVVVAIVGVLATIALAVYGDYAIRSKLSEAEAAIGACQTSVTDYLSKHAGAFPPDATTAGCSTTSTQYVATIAVGPGGAISATTQHTGAAPTECTLTLTPVFTAPDTVSVTTWAGSFSGCAAKFVPSAFR